MARNVEMNVEGSSNDFPEHGLRKDTTMSRLHSLEGSLWIPPSPSNAEHIHMFCQVNPAQWAMVDLFEGNRNVDAFTVDNVPLAELKQFRRFTGKVTLKTL